MATRKIDSSKARQAPPLSMPVDRLELDFADGVEGAARRAAEQIARLTAVVASGKLLNPNETRMLADYSQVLRTLQRGPIGATRSIRKREGR